MKKVCLEMLYNDSIIKQKMSYYLFFTFLGYQETF